MKHRIALALFFGFAVAFLSLRVSAQTTRPASAVQETEDEVKVAVYKRFVDNRLPNPALAYEAAKEYMRRYGKENDEYTRYLKLWIPAYEKDDRTQRLPEAIYASKNYAEGYNLAKQVLADDPDNVKALIALGYGGYLATTTAKNETFNADSVRYARKAIQLIEAGRTPDEWKPFQNKDDVLASLHYAIGFLELKTRPEEATADLIKALQYESDLKKSPFTYYYLAFTYEKGPYQRLSADYSKRFANQPETPESKAALDNLNRVIDRIIDAYARAVALTGTDPKYQASKTEWMKQLTTFYRFRHDNSDAGLNEFIAGALARPLPQQ